MALANNPGGSTLGGTITVTANAGVADFDDLTLDKPGVGYTLQASGNSLTPATTDAFDVAGLVVTAQPPNSVVAGAPFEVDVQVQDGDGTPDPNYNGTVTLSLANNPGGATLGGTTTITIDDGSGEADFDDLTLDKPGQGYTLQASSENVDSATTNPFDVMTDKLVVTTQPPSDVFINKPFDVQISAEDANSNVDPNFNGNVTIAMANNPGCSTLGGTLTVAANAGVADFKDLTLDKLGQGYTLQASGDNLAPATTDPFDVGIDLSPLELLAAGGFTPDTQTNQYNASGTIQIGLEPAAGQPFQPFLQLAGSASYNATTIQLDGTVSADIGPVTCELFEGSWTINVGQSSTNSIQLTPGSQSLTLGGLSVSVESLALTPQGIALQGSISLPTAASGNAGPLSFAANGPLNMSVDGNNSILISQVGISISGGQLQLPDTTLTYNNITFAATGLTAQYEAAATPSSPTASRSRGPLPFPLRSEPCKPIFRPRIILLSPA